MIVGSHNSWSYLPVKKWWMKSLAFTAKCQSYTIKEQYILFNVKCFDLRIKFNKEGVLQIVHGKIIYEYSYFDLYNDLEWLNNLDDTIYIRILHDVRTKEEYTNKSIELFRYIAMIFQDKFTKLKFWCGRNLYNWKEDYEFLLKPSCEEKYASVRNPKLLDDWIPFLYAYMNNRKILKEGTDKDILLIDFVEYGY